MADDAKQTETSGEQAPVVEATEGEETLSVRDLADEDFDTALTVGAIPLVILGVLMVVAIFIYFTRKKNAWTTDEIEEDKDAKSSPEPEDVEFPTTDELSKMDETEPAKKL